MSHKRPPGELKCAIVISGVPRRAPFASMAPRAAASMNCINEPTEDSAAFSDMSADHFVNRQNKSINSFIYKGFLPRPAMPEQSHSIPRTGAVEEQSHFVEEDQRLFGSVA